MKKINICNMNMLYIAYILIINNNNEKWLYWCNFMMMLFRIWFRWYLIFYYLLWWSVTFLEGSMILYYIVIYIRISIWYFWLSLGTIFVEMMFFEVIIIVKLFIVSCYYFCYLWYLFICCLYNAKKLAPVIYNNTYMRSI